MRALVLQGFPSGELRLHPARRALHWARPAPAAAAEAEHRAAVLSSALPAEAAGCGGAAPEAGGRDGVFDVQHKPW